MAGPIEPWCHITKIKNQYTVTLIEQSNFLLIIIKLVNRYVVSCQLFKCSMHAQNEYNLHACMQVAILHSSTARVASQHYLIQVALLNMANGSTTDFYNTI